MIWRPGPDGTLMAPRRGPPPTPPEGYRTRPGNPYIVEPILVDCDHRYFKQFAKPCCGGKTGSTWCKSFDKAVLNKDCQGCKVEPKKLPVAK